MTATIQATPRRFRLRIAGASLALLGVSINAAHANDPAVLTLTTEHFKETAAVADDPVTGTATISTEPGFVEHTGPMRMVWHDEYLEGIIDGKTAHKSYRITAFVIYSGSLRSYETATFSAQIGPQSVKTTALQKKAEFCATGTCTYTERVAFPIEEETLRQAAENSTGKPGLWRFELVAKAGPKYTGSLSTAEIAGFLAKVDETAKSAPVAKASTQAMLQHDLGIEGIPVAATEDQPNRRGILIAGVKSGSVAQKAGIIIGDILYEIDGHKLTTPADLQSAVAASANARIPVRLYRGMSTVTVTAQF